MPRMDRPRPTEGLTRRDALRVAAGGAVLAATASPAAALAGRRRQGAGRRDACVLGGGMAGLAAAHELAERGFRVTVYERKALGGKARSIPVQGTAKGGRRPLPGRSEERRVGKERRCRWPPYH